MAKLYWNNNGVTCCFPLTTTQPSGHSLAVNNNGTTQYLKLSAGATSALNVNINGTQYGAVSYPENTDILITPSFVCKRRASSEELCIYANGNLILNTASTSCTAISITEDAVITICGPYSGCYCNWTLNDGYLALNFTEQNACIHIKATALPTEGCGYTYNSAVDGEGCNYVCSVSDTWVGAVGGKTCINVALFNTTTSHCYNGSFTIKANNGRGVYTTCTTTFNGNASNFFEVNFPAMTNMCMYDNDYAYASYIGIELNGCCLLNNTACPVALCCGFTGLPVGSVQYPSGIWWWSGTGDGNHCLSFKDYSFTRVEV